MVYFIIHLIIDRKEFMHSMYTSATRTATSTKIKVKAMVYTHGTQSSYPLTVNMIW